MLELIGKEFSTETRRARAYLEERGIDHRFIDVDFDEDALNWLKAHKIMGLPVLRCGSLFVVGERDIPRLLAEQLSCDSDHPTQNEHQKDD